MTLAAILLFLLAFGGYRVYRNKELKESLEKDFKGWSDKFEEQKQSLLGSFETLNDSDSEEELSDEEMLLSGKKKKERKSQESKEGWWDNITYQLSETLDEVAEKSASMYSSSNQEKKTQNSESSLLSSPSRSGANQRRKQEQKYEDEGPLIAVFRNVMSEGMILRQFTQRGGKTVKLWLEGDDLVLAPTSSFTKRTSRVCMQDIEAILIGKKTSNFSKKAGYQLEEECCFSILTPKGSVDLEASSPKERDALVRGIKDLKKKVLGKEKKSKKKKSKKSKKDQEREERRRRFREQAQREASSSKLSEEREEKEIEVEEREREEEEIERVGGEREEEEETHDQEETDDDDDEIFSEQDQDEDLLEFED